MEIPLHPDIERFVLEQLEGGCYAAAEEVVTEALYLLWQRDCLFLLPCSNASGGTLDRTSRSVEKAFLLELRDY